MLPCDVSADNSSCPVDAFRNGTLRGGAQGEFEDRVIGNDAVLKSAAERLERSAGS